MEASLKEVISTLKSREMLPAFPEGYRVPLPAVNKVELYLSFYGNDCCRHCITNAGPHRKEVMKPEDARKVLQNVAGYSVINRLRSVAAGGDFDFKMPDDCRKLDELTEPPPEMTDELIARYSDCLMGKGYISRWVKGGSSIDLNFGRPSVRLSGGEFFTWPHELEGRKIPESERLVYQKELLEDIREILPEYDIYILTNGRFAESGEKARQVVKHWAGGTGGGRGRTRISISLDIFHSPPKKSTVEEMLSRIWAACREYGLGAPFLYGLNNYWVALAGRALEEFGCCYGCRPEVNDAAGSEYIPGGDIRLDPVDLTATGGCRELKGFVCETEYGSMLVNNIVVMPSGRLAYCCACVGDFGSFLDDPADSLRNIMTDPVAVMLRREQTAINLLNIAVELDPSIKVFGYGRKAAATGSTCYQLLSGRRPKAE